LLRQYRVNYGTKYRAKATTFSLGEPIIGAVYGAIRLFGGNFSREWWFYAGMQLSIWGEGQER
jgi:hypothetical protein